MLTSPLVEYGIHTEESDIRAHVSVVNRAIYVFETWRGVEAITRNNPPLRHAGQPGVKGPTAEGWVVAVGSIEDLRRLRFHSWGKWSDFTAGLSTTEKGAMAVECVMAAMLRGRFPLWIAGREAEGLDAQIAGTDILIALNKRVQVKCDFRGGDGPPNGNGTGNLYLQKAERNPLKHR